MVLAFVFVKRTSAKIWPVGSAPKFELSVQGREGAGFFGRKTREFERSTLHSVRNKYEKKPILVVLPA